MLIASTASLHADENWSATYAYLNLKLFDRCFNCRLLVQHSSGVRRIFQWGVSVTSHRDDVKILQ